MADQKKSKAEKFLEHMASGNSRPMTEVSSATGGVLPSSPTDPLSNVPDLPDFGDGELQTPGQLMDGIYALLIQQVSRLEDRVDFMLSLLVEQGWMEKPVTEEMLDEMVAARLQAATEPQENSSGVHQRVFRREGKNGDVGYVVKSVEDDADASEET